MDSVSVAFELVQVELNTAVENLNAEGVTLFRNSHYSDAARLSEKGEQLRLFCERVEQLSRDWEQLFADDIPETGISNDPSGAARKILEHQKSPKTRLLVRFPDGSVISENKAADSLVLSLEKIGLQVVSALNIPVNKENLVSRSSSPRGYGECQSGDFFIKTHSSTEQKRRTLEKVSELLQLGLVIEVI